jgi:hypothetical protein
MFGRFSPGLPGFLPLLALSFGLIGGASAQSPVTQTPTNHQVANQPSARERTLFAESYANERLAVWQQRLNLQDWTISIVMARATELKPKTLGNVHWDLPKKTAVIRVLDPSDYHLAEHEMLQDMEFTVVHELIHLELAPVLSDLQRSDANRRDEEHSVNHMADALLKLDRSKVTVP